MVALLEKLVCDIAGEGQGLNNNKSGPLCTKLVNKRSRIAEKQHWLEIKLLENIFPWMWLRIRKIAKNWMLQFNRKLGATKKLKTLYRCSKCFSSRTTESDALTPSWNSTYWGSNFVELSQLVLFNILEKIVLQCRIIPIFETFFGQEMPTVPL